MKGVEVTYQMEAMRVLEVNSYLDKLMVVEVVRSEVVVVMEEVEVIEVQDVSMGHTQNDHNSLNVTKMKHTP